MPRLESPLVDLLQALQLPADLIGADNGAMQHWAASVDVACARFLEVVVANKCRMLTYFTLRCDSSDSRWCVPACAVVW